MNLSTYVCARAPITGSHLSALHLGGSGFTPNSLTTKPPSAQDCQASRSLDDFDVLVNWDRGFVYTDYVFSLCKKTRVHRHLHDNLHDNSHDNSKQLDNKTKN